MNEAREISFNWWLPISGAIGAVLLSSPTLIWGNDAGAFFASIPLAILIAVVLLAVALTRLRRQSLAVAAMVIIFIVLAFSLFRASDYLRTYTRWLVQSQSYKTQVLNEPTPSNGSLKHVEWDGWGFPGAGDTTVYLVNDPNDRLGKLPSEARPENSTDYPARWCGYVASKAIGIRFCFTPTPIGIIALSLSTDGFAKSRVFGRITNRDVLI